MSEANCQEAGKNKKHQNSTNQNDAPADFMMSESPRYVGRAVVATDPKAKKKSGRVFTSWGLAHEYKFTNLDGTRPDWGQVCYEKIWEVQGLR